MVLPIFKILNFNSIKVQLKLTYAVHDRQLSVFQFHKGTIKTNDLIGQAFFYLYFNSIKVQLKHGRTIFLPTENSFQFHKGTIKTTTLSY